MLLGLLVAAEAAARTDWARDALPLRGLGSGHIQFQIKYSRLEDWVHTQGEIECLLIGNSTMQVGFSPSVLSQVLERETGQPLACFNFGVGGMTQGTQSRLAGILVEDFRPSILIAGVDIPGLKEGVAPVLNDAILASPWVRFRLGDPNLDGWLLAHSYAYRYFDPFRSWMDRSYMDDVWSELDRLKNLSADGYASPVAVLEEGGEEQAERDMAARRVMQGYRVARANLDGIRATLDLRDRAQVVFVEMPIHKTYVDFIEGGQVTYQAALDRVTGVMEEEGAIFLRISESEVSIPDEGWLNRNHMNRTGAAILTTWVAQQLARLYQDGQLTHPGAAP